MTQIPVHHPDPSVYTALARSGPPEPCVRDDDGLAGVVAPAGGTEARPVAFDPEWLPL